MEWNQKDKLVKKPSEKRDQREAHVARKVRRMILNRLERLDRKAIFDPEEEGV